MRKRLILPMLGALALLLATCGQRPATAQQSTEASTYSEAENGTATASGIPFSDQGMTAAHKTLPFGTQVEVCAARCATVTITDRGPFVGGRDLDLSPAAMAAIGGDGLAQVTYTANGTARASPTPGDEHASGAPRAPRSAQPAQAVTNRSLATTGAPTGLLAALAAVLVLVGLALVLLSRRMEGPCLLSSHDMSFMPDDDGKPILGAGIPPGVRIRYVSPTKVIIQ